MFTDFPWLGALAAGVVIVVLDTACTLIFAVKPWEAELRRQGLQPRKLTPPYYVLANLLGGVILAFVYTHFAASFGPGAGAALVASLLVWSVSRIYGGGHVVMGQMPLKIFLVMSAGLGLGYLAGGQVLRVLLGH